jgi:hypothetical protein
MVMKGYVRTSGLITAWCVGLLLVGCASYYKVTEPLSGKVFYTEEIKQERGGAVKLKDARTGGIITLQNSEVNEISSKEFEAALKAPAEKPAPMPAPAAAPAPAGQPAPADTPAQPTESK